MKQMLISSVLSLCTFYLSAQSPQVMGVIRATQTKISMGTQGGCPQWPIVWNQLTEGSFTWQECSYEPFPSQGEVPYHDYLFEGSAGQTVGIQAHYTGLGLMVLFDPSQNLIAISASTAAYFCTVIAGTLPATGTYTLRLSPISGYNRTPFTFFNSFDYHLKLEEPTPQSCGSWSTSLLPDTYSGVGLDFRTVHFTMGSNYTYEHLWQIPDEDRSDLPLVAFAALTSAYPQPNPEGLVFSSPETAFVWNYTPLLTTPHVLVYGAIHPLRRTIQNDIVFPPTTYTANLSGCFDIVLYDDQNKAKICINSATKAYSFEIMSGSQGASGPFTGTASLTRYGTLYSKYMSQPGSPQPFQVYIFHYNNSAHGYFYVNDPWNSAILHDSNILDNPPGCGTASDNPQ